MVCCSVLLKKARRKDTSFLILMCADHHQAGCCCCCCSNLYGEMMKKKADHHQAGCCCCCSTSSPPPRAPPSQVDLMTPSHNREFGGSSIFGTSLHLFFYWFIGLLPTVCISSFLLLSPPSHFFCSSMLALESLIF